MNVRFFKKLPTGQFINPVPGTVVDNTITRPERYSFMSVFVTLWDSLVFADSTSTWCRSL